MPIVQMIRHAFRVAGRRQAAVIAEIAASVAGAIERRTYREPEIGARRRPRGTPVAGGHRRGAVRRALRRGDRRPPLSLHGQPIQGPRRPRRHILGHDQRVSCQRRHASGDIHGYAGGDPAGDGGGPIPKRASACLTSGSPRWLWPSARSPTRWRSRGSCGTASPRPSCWSPSERGACVGRRKEHMPTESIIIGGVADQRRRHEREVDRLIEPSRLSYRPV
jgi:hypothetical protein